MATVDDGDRYTAGLTSAFTKAFEELGGRVSPQVRIEQGRTDMRGALAEIAEVYADDDQPAVLQGIFLPLFTEEGIPFTEQVSTQREFAGTTLIAGAALLVPSFLALSESLGAYIAGPAPLDTTNVDEATGSAYADALQDYQALHGAPTMPYWAHTYEAVTLLLSAIESVAEDVGGTLHVDRALLRLTLTETEDFGGLPGTLSCDNFGDCGTGEVSIFHHTDASITDPAGLEPVYP